MRGMINDMLPVIAEDDPHEVLKIDTDNFTEPEMNVRMKCEDKWGNSRLDLLQWFECIRWLSIIDWNVNLN